jgi:hypothetical protein
VIALHCYGVEIPRERKAELIRYLFNKLRPEMGWGLCVVCVERADGRHTAAPPTVFGTVMNYVMLRMLGVGPDEGPMTVIRAKIHELGALQTSSTDTRRRDGHSDVGQGVALDSRMLRLGGREPHPARAVVPP